MLLSLFEFWRQPLVDLRESIWLSVFAQGCRSGVGGMIFTFAPERTVRASFIAEVERLIRQSRGRVDVVALVCPLAELKGSMECESQRKF